MANLPQQNTIVQYVADGVTTDYVVTFYTPIETDGTPNLDVFTQSASAPPIPEDDLNEWNVDYTFEPNIDFISGGTLTFLPGHVPPNGYIVTIVRDVQASLDVEFSQAQNFSGITLDAALDKLLLISQQNKSYALGRNLSYIVNTYLPESTISANVQIPVLEDGQIWFGSANGVIAATLEQPADVSTLRSELANEQPTTNGAAIVGFYDDVNSNPTTVADQLNYLTDLVVASTPTGSLLDFAGTSAPTGFLLCDGTAISRVTYDDLFDVIGTTWGIGDGSTTFNVPDFRRRVAMGSGGSGTATIGNAVGNTGGGETETLTSPLQLPSHSHTAATTSSLTTKSAASVTSPGVVPAMGPASAFTSIFPVISTTTIGNTGASSGFNITQKSAIVLKIIKT